MANGGLIDGKTMENIPFELIVVGASWCGPCKKVKVELPKLLDGIASQLVVRYLDLDEDEEECDGMDITKIPMLVFRCDGVDKETFVGSDSALLGKFISKCKVHLCLGMAFGASI